MPVMLIDIFSAVVFATVGIVLGWWLRGPFSRQVAADGGDDTRHAKEALSRLHQLAARVAADVGQHTSRVEEINEELTSTDSREAEAVVAAVTKLIDANSQMQTQLGQAEEKLQEQTRLIESRTIQARTDPLTGLANRRAFDEEIDRRLAEYNRQGNVFSVVMIDIDHFKQFNDTHGHQAGDEVLRGLADVLRETAREMDEVARYGGEEFAMILPRTRIEEACTAAERVRAAIDATRFNYADKALLVTASLGVAELRSGEDVETLIRRADSALYVTKDSGRNRVSWHDGNSVHTLEIDNGSTEEPEVEEEAQEAPEEVPSAPEPEDASPPTDESRPDEPPRDELQPDEPPRDELPPVRRDREELCDRESFRSLLGQRLSEWSRGGVPPSVMLVRIDDYSKLTSSYGQQAADMALRATTQFLKAAIRDMDLLARHDVATFSVLLPGANLAHTIGIAERLREAISHCALPFEGDTLRFTVSLGGAEAIGDESAARLLGRTEEALDAALKGGGNCSYFHNGQWSETASASLERIG